MSSKELLIAANTIWVVLAAILVMFMQAGFAFLEAGLTRMKNAAHIAGKNVLIFAVCSLVYYAVGFGIAFGDGNSFIGTSGFFPSSNELLAIGQAPSSFFTGIPAASGYLFEVVFAGVSLAIVWGAMAERAKLWVYPAFGVVFTLIYSVTSHWIWQSGGWLFGIAHQKCVQHWRQQTREDSLLREFAESPDALDERPDDLLVRQEQEDEFMTFLDRLPPPQRSVLLLHYIEDFSLEQIASITQTELGTVKSRMHYAKKTLRRLLEEKK